MKQEIDPKWIGKVAEALIYSDMKTATKYLTTKLVVRATWHNKPAKANRLERMAVTYGCPNYLEVKFIKDCIAAKEPFPVKNIVLKPWPKKRVSKPTTKGN